MSEHIGHIVTVQDVEPGPEWNMMAARQAILGLIRQTYGPDAKPNDPGDMYAGTTVLEQVLAEIHGTFQDVEA